MGHLPILWIRDNVQYTVSIWGLDHVSHAWLIRLVCTCVSVPTTHTCTSPYWYSGHINVYSLKAVGHVSGYGCLFIIVYHQHIHVHTVHLHAGSYQYIYHQHIQCPQTLGCIPVLAQLLYQQDPDVLRHSCWTAAFLADGPNSRIQKIVDGGLVGRLVELMMHHERTVVVPALRAVGNILTGDDVQTQVYIYSGTSL